MEFGRNIYEHQAPGFVASHNGFLDVMDVVTPQKSKDFYSYCSVYSVYHLCHNCIPINFSLQLVSHNSDNVSWLGYNFVISAYHDYWVYE